MSIIATNPKIIRIFTTNIPLAHILHHLGVNLNGDRCCAKTKKGTRCQRKNCRTTFMCKQHQEIWQRNFNFDMFYALQNWELCHYSWCINLWISPQNNIALNDKEHSNSTEKIQSILI